MPRASYQREAERAIAHLASIGIAPQMGSARMHAAMIIGTGPAVVTDIRAIKATGHKIQFVTLSNNASDGFTQLLGADAQGVIISASKKFRR
jgi:branched-chain amino acid transport system substrate-binding protein